MRRHAVALFALVLAASTAHGAQARQGCPTLTDDKGDTGALGFHVPSDASDLTSVDVSTSRTMLTASLTVVGQPVNNEPGMSRIYDVYFETGENDYVLRGTLGNGESLFQLVSHSLVADTGLGTTADHWQSGKAIQGHVHGHTVTINAPLDRDLPLLGHRVQVSAEAWIAAANDISVAGTRSPDGVAVGVDGTEARAFRVGDRGCA
ncbi:MAG: hypothetical protein QOJ79_3205 [Actinomycetota bacterium]|jgi:hypothetical protein|nr:hypothetical protein [Actinomycetota bacterium]